MLSPGYIFIEQATTKQSISPHVSERSLHSPMSDCNGSNIMLTFHQPHSLPIHCYQSVMPPPPHNILSAISNNNNSNAKNFNRSNSWHNTKKNSREGKNDKQNLNNEKDKEKQENQQVACPRISPENKSKMISTRRLHEKNNVSLNSCQNFYSPNSQNESINHTNFFTFYSPHHQRIGHYHKNRYFTNRSGNKQKKNSLSSDGHSTLVDILMDRFLSRTDIVELRRHPKELVNGGEWDRLSCQIWDYYLSTQQTESTYRNKIMLWKYLYTFIRNVFPRYGLFLVGSTMSGFGTNTSDVDMCLLVRPTFVDQRSEALSFLEQIQKALQSCDFVKDIELIWAKVPILKFRDEIRNLDVDLNCNNSVGIRNTHLLHCYASLDWRVRALVLVVKMWARSNNINDAKNMTISSYSLALMVIHFLQCGVTPPVIPCLHGLYPGKFHMESDIHSIDMQEQLHSFHSDNHQSLGELLMSFLHYYSRFEYSIYAISVRLGARIPIDECRLARSHRNDPHQWKLLCIEEPFDVSNTARSVYDVEVFEKVKTVFINSYSKLNESRDLSSIFKQNDTKKI